MQNAEIGNLHNLLAQGRDMAYIADLNSMDLALAWALRLDGKTDQERFSKEELNWGLRTWDMWNFNDCDSRFGDDWPGRIPAQLVAHTLFYFTNQGDLVFDPMAGGGRGPGRAWRGIVEETPAIWCSWVVAAGRASGRGVPLRIKVNDVWIPIPGVRVGYGVRYFFRCPSCRRKCEAVYILAGRPACRKCHRLGYRSQARRWSSVYAILGPLFDRDLTAPARYFVDDQLLRDELVEAQDTIKTRLLAILDGVSVEYGDDQVEGT